MLSCNITRQKIRKVKTILGSLGSNKLSGMLIMTKLKEKREPALRPDMSPIKMLLTNYEIHLAMSNKTRYRRLLRL